MFWLVDFRKRWSLSMVHKFWSFFNHKTGSAVLILGLSTRVFAVMLFSFPWWSLDITLSPFLFIKNSVYLWRIFSYFIKKTVLGSTPKRLWFFNSYKHFVRTLLHLWVEKENIMKCHKKRKGITVINPENYSGFHSFSSIFLRILLRICIS